ncbi:deoxyribonuclease IV [Allonocardiopsis opalescens]|uniref:Probable endonuclease 4 n=1 Tax=Allonocardiopsis opalescens TaxID=1144618 RepID=A0A2T0QCT4_9ACTN|nr:deoxyribonuclease IV [Allonocardiopsis opalescens]PRY01680.1 endonuclease IV [Allonocardiopsis opalescens]
MTAEPAAPVSPVGAHVPVAGGLARAGLSYAEEVGAEAVQVFVGNPRGWAASPGRPDQDTALLARIALDGLPVFVHAPYLVNPGTPRDDLRERSRASLAHALARGAAIGARGVVVHTGSAVGGTREEGLARTRETLLPLLDALPPDGPDLLLEPMAGQGQVLCARVGELVPYLDALDRHPKAGVCLDACHAFAAGHDIGTPGGMAALLDELVAAVGPGRLRLVHANDAKDDCGSRRDRHENIGAGRIGAEPFATLFRHPASAGVPIVVETPGPAGPHAADIATLKRLRDTAPAPAFRRA